MVKSDKNWKIVEDKRKNKKNDKFEKKQPVTSVKKNESEKIDTTINTNENRNLKKILCQNIIDYHECKYGSKCLYAHNLVEQNIDTKRRAVYELIDSTSDLSEFDLRKNHSVYKILLELSKLCKNCMENKCIGGYNCKAGSCVKKYCICLSDLNNGICQNPGCEFVHLTKRGLKPFYYRKKNYSENFLDINLNTIEVYDNDNNSNISEIDMNDDSSDDNDEENEMKDEEYIENLCNESIFD
jgi:hypothetical protein